MSCEVIDEMGVLTSLDLQITVLPLRKLMKNGQGTPRRQSRFEGELRK